MNLNNLLPTDAKVAAKNIFNGAIGQTNIIKINAGEMLKEHITKTQALLICLQGNATYEDENDQSISLQTSDYHLIEPGIKHWIKANENSLFLLIK